MKKFSVTAGLTAFLLSLVSLAVQARPAANQWWFQSATVEPKPVVSGTKPETPSTQPTLVTDEPVPETLKPAMQPHAPFDPRQLPHDPCPPCGMG